MSPFVHISPELLLALSLATGAPAPEAQSLAWPVEPSRRAELSSEYLRAVGPYRFSEQSWLKALKETDCGAPCTAAGPRIFRTSSGRYYVPSPDERGIILAQRRDRSVAEPVATAFAKANVTTLAARLGRPPVKAELLVAHLFGADRAVDLVTRRPSAPAARDVVAASLRGAAADTPTTQHRAARSADAGAGWSTRVRLAR